MKISNRTDYFVSQTTNTIKLLEVFRSKYLKKTIFYLTASGKYVFLARDSVTIPYNTILN